MTIRRPLAAAPLVLVSALLLAAGPARADGDPASDVLVVEKLYVPFEVTLPETLQKALTQATTEAARAGHPIRVALVTTPSDLGAIPSLFGKPETYAQFLWQELSFVYHGRVLVVMPTGFGIYGGRKRVAAERLLAGIKIGAGANGMAASALDAVLALAEAAGHPLQVKPIGSTPPAKPTSASSSRDRLLIAGAAVLVVTAAIAVRYLRRHQRRLLGGGRQ